MCEKEAFILCSFTTRFRSLIWFLIFTFTLYCFPHFELLIPYKIHFSLPEAEAAELPAADSEASAIPASEPAAPQAPQEISDQESSTPTTVPGFEVAPRPSYTDLFYPPEYRGMIHYIRDEHGLMRILDNANWYKCPGYKN